MDALKALCLVVLVACCLALGGALGWAAAKEEAARQSPDPHALIEWTEGYKAGYDRDWTDREEAKP